MTRRRTNALALVASLAAGGCAGGPMRGSVQAISLGGDPVYLDGDCATVFYGDPNATETSFVLTDVPLEKLLGGQVTDGLVIHLDLLWLPEGGKTPMDPSATNVSIRYVVFSGGEVGVYGGAGFALPDRDPGGRTTSLTLRDASMSLLDATGGFVDLLSPARLTGRLTARRDEKRTLEIRRATSKLVTSALGRNRVVRLPQAETSASDPSAAPQQRFPGS